MVDKVQLSSPFGPILYRRDALGYPHVWAPERHAGAFARGWFHAVDRRLQVELNRAAAEGNLMAHLGPEPVARALARATRSIGLATGLDEQVALLEPATLAYIEAYCAGFAAGAASRGLPLAGRLLGLPKRAWTPRDVLLTGRLVSWFGLTSLTQTARIAVAQLLAAGVEVDAMRALLGPGAEGLDVEACRDLAPIADHNLAGVPLQYGSNAFAVDGQRSTSGCSLLMSEFHMEVGRFPPICHVSLVQYPDGTYEQGVSLPGLPFVSAGRSEKLAWGYTFGHPDDVDVTTQRVRGARRQRGEAWVDLERRDEEVAIRGKATETWTFWDFDGGTLLGQPDETSDQTQVLAAVQWRGMKHTARSLNATLEAQLASDLEQLLEAHRRMPGWPLVGVFADEKRVARINLGLVPARRSGWGPRAGWNLTDDPDLPESARPVVVDPQSGVVVSANEPAPGWTAFAEPRYRAQRLTERLVEQSRGPASVAPDDLLRASYDEYDACAARLMAVWADLLPESAAECVAWATDQPGKNDARGRLHYATFVALRDRVAQAFVARWIGAEPAEEMLVGSTIGLALQEHVDCVLAIEHPELLDREGLRALLVSEWDAAVADAGSDEAAGPFRGKFSNVVTQGKLPTWMGWSSAPVDHPGGPTSPFQSRRAGFGGQTFAIGPAFHLLIDMAEPGLRYNICGGASERRFGPGYGRGVQEWRDGVLLPLRPSD